VQQKKNKQVAQLLQRNRTEGWVCYGKKWKTETVVGDNIYGHYKSICNQCDVFGQHSNQIWWKPKIRAIILCCSRLFKVIKVGTNRKPVCDFLLAINSNWQPISYRCGVIAAYCSNFWHFAFLSHPLRDLRATHDDHLNKNNNNNNADNF